MSTDIYWEQCVIMTRKSSILLPSLDLLILRIAESGLAAYWENEVNIKTRKFSISVIVLGIYAVFRFKSTTSS